jgi:predicted Zn-dependent protease
VILAFFSSCAYAADDQVLLAPRAGEWRNVVREKAQTYEGFVASAPFRFTGSETVYILPVGSFSKDHRRLIGSSAAYMQQRLGVPVVILPDYAMSTVPQDGARLNPHTGQFQLSAPYMIENVIEKRASVGYAAVIALTAQDIWPGDDTNYVLGLATPQTRVALLSFARIWEGGAEANKAADRFKKLIFHETLHTFGLAHETDVACVMNGYNSVAELDRLSEDLGELSARKLAYVLREVKK